MLAWLESPFPSFFANILRYKIDANTLLSAYLFRNKKMIHYLIKIMGLQQLDLSRIQGFIKLVFDGVPFPYPTPGQMTMVSDGVTKSGYLMNRKRISLRSQSVRLKSNRQRGSLFKYKIVALTTYFCVVYKFSLLVRGRLQYYYYFHIYLQTSHIRGKGQPTFVCKLC